MVRRRILIIAVLVLPASIFLAFVVPPSRVNGRSAQTVQSEPHAHVEGPSNMIDGAIHPEMIQDTAAYRLFFLAATDPLATPEETVTHQRAILAPARLTEEELQSAIQILNTFKTQYDQVVQKYNTSAEAALANDIIVDVRPFLTERRAIVQAERLALENALAQETMARLNTYIQGEKAKMRVTVDVDGGQ